MINENKDQIALPLKKHSNIMAFRRNIEKFIADAMGPEQVGQFLDELFSGRFKPPVNLSAARPPALPTATTTSSTK